MNCNHIIGVYHPRFGEDKLTNRKEFLLRKKTWRGQIFINCSKCKQKIWNWTKKYNKKLGSYQMLEYIGG